MIEYLLKVMLVDDEEKERSLLKLCINWAEIGMEIVGEASSAREALDLIGELSPDIIITDIRMPFMDGLEFSKIVVETYPYIKVMVLTAYEEFEYAKEGIKIGVADFLLKPIKRIEMKNALINLKSKIEAERLHKNEYNELKKRLDDSFPYLKEKFLNELIQTSISEDDIKSKLDYFSIGSFSNYIQVALIESSHAEIDVGEEQRVLLCMKCTEIVKQYFKEDSEMEVFVDNSQRIVVLNGNPSIELIECCEQIKAMVINRLKCYVSIGVGGLYKDLKEIRKSYKDACEALNYKVLYGRNNIVSFEDTSINQNTWNVKQDEINEIGFSVKLGMSDKAVEAVNSIFDDFFNQGLSSIDYIRITSINIVTVVLNSITELGLNYKDVFVSRNLPYSDVLKLETVPDTKKYFTEMVACVVNSVKNSRTKKTNKAINEIMTYMKEHLKDPGLSLTSVAKEFFLNSSYLSRAFKQETGYTFVEYLTRSRIEKAMSLFKDTDLMLYEVAEEIGIPDPNYFGKCFKKHVGVSVNDYRKSS